MTGTKAPPKIALSIIITNALKRGMTGVRSPVEEL
jgi:hypothetical protein